MKVFSVVFALGVALLAGCAKQPVYPEPQRVDSVSEDQAQQRSDYVRTDRYTLASTTPLLEQREPMVAIVHMRFAQDVGSVGQATRELLEGSGYRLLPSSDSRAELQDSILMAQMLPAVHREIGPVTLLDALAILGGRAWQVNVDHVYRLVWFSVSDEAAQ